MEKKYIVRLTVEERKVLRDVVKKLKRSSQKVRRAQVLFMADADGPNWTEKNIAEAFSCRTKTVENVRRRLLTDGFKVVLNNKKRESPPRSNNGVFLKGNTWAMVSMNNKIFGGSHETYSLFHCNPDRLGFSGTG